MVFSGLALLAALWFAHTPRRGALGVPLLPSGDEPEIPRGASTALWPVKPEDFVHPAERLRARMAAESSGGRWAVIGRDGYVWGRFKTREEAFLALRQAGYTRPAPKGTAETRAETEGWTK